MNRITLLIMGGSQGSQMINTRIQQWLETHPHEGCKLQLIHQVGQSESCDKWVSWYEQQCIPACVFSYVSQVKSLYQVADCIICRAGSGMLAEVLFWKKPAFVIPLKTKTTTHQVDNARAFVAKHPDLAIMCENDALFDDDFSKFIENIIQKTTYSCSHSKKNVEL